MEIRCDYHDPDTSNIPLPTGAPMPTTTPDALTTVFRAMRSLATEEQTLGEPEILNTGGGVEHPGWSEEDWQLLVSWRSGESIECDEVANPTDGESDLCIGLYTDLSGDVAEHFSITPLDEHGLKCEIERLLFAEGILDR